MTACPPFSVDLDSDALLSGREALSTTLPAGSLDERLAFAFRLYDARGAGAITAPEALRILREGCLESGLQVSEPALEELNRRLFEAAAAVTAAGRAAASATASCQAQPPQPGSFAPGQRAAVAAGLAGSSSSAAQPVLVAAAERPSQHAAAEVPTQANAAQPLAVQPQPLPLPACDGLGGAAPAGSAGVGGDRECPASLRERGGSPGARGPEQATLTFEAFRALVLEHPELVRGLALPSPGPGKRQRRGALAVLAHWAAACSLWAHVSPQRFFTALVIAAVVLGAFAKEFGKYARQEERLSLMGWGLPVAKGSGEAMKVICALLLLPVCGKTVTGLRATWLRRVLPFDDAILFHKTLAFAGFGFAWAHTLACIMPFARAVDMARRTQYAAAFPADPASWMPLAPSVKAFLGSYVFVTGALMLLILCIMFTFALEWPRQALCVRDSAVGRVLNNFDTFRLTHHLFLAFYALLIFHPHPGLPPRCFNWGASDTWLWVAAPLTLLAGERVVRAWRSYAWRVPVLDVEQLTPDVVALTLAKPRGFRHAAGQYALLQCRAISCSEWHPFTISSAPDASHLTFHVRAAGDWTRALVARVAQAAATRCSLKEGAAGEGSEGDWLCAAPSRVAQAAATRCGAAQDSSDAGDDPETGAAPDGLVPEQDMAQLACTSAMLGPLPAGCTEGAGVRGACLESVRHLSVRVRAGIGRPAWFTSKQVSLTRLWKRNGAAASPTALPTPGLLTLAVDGPYGAPAQLAGHYRVLLLVGAGIGIAPFAAVLHGLLRQFRAAYGDGLSVRKAYFVWAARDQNAAAWFAAALQSISSLDTQRRLEIDIYYTRARAPTDARMTLFRVAQVAAHQQVGIDVVSGLQSRVITHFGRPDFDAIMHRVAEAHTGEAVGTFYCGPPLLAKALEAGCRRASRAAARGGGGARFVFHKEHF